MMARRTGDYERTPPTRDPLLTLALLAGIGLVLWLFARKRPLPIVPVSALLQPSPLVSPWSPLP